MPFPRSIWPPAAPARRVGGLLTLLTLHHAAAIDLAAAHAPDRARQHAVNPFAGNADTPRRFPAPRFSISTASGIASRNAFSSPAISFRMTAANYDQRRLEFGRAMWAAPARAFRLECPGSPGSADAPYHMKASMAA